MLEDVPAVTDRADHRWWLSTLLAAACCALGAAWVVEPLLDMPTWPMRIGFLLSGLLLAIIVIQIANVRRSSQSKAAQRYIDLLCRIEPHLLADESTTAALPRLSSDNPWAPVFQRVHNCLADYARQLDEARHLSSIAEVRARHASRQFEQLTEILNGLSDPVVAIDQFGEITLSNQSAQRLLKLPVEADTHAALEQLDLCEELVSLLGETRKRRIPAVRQAETELSDEQGRKHWFRITCKALAGDEQSSGNEQHGAVAVLTDISGQKAIQKRNAEFVSAVSHEMKTPLSSIRAYVELLADDEAEDDATREEFLKVIESQTDRLQRLIDNLLNLARIEAGVVAVQKLPQSLNELLGEAVNLLQPAAQQKNITLSSELSPMYLGVLADRDTLLQAAINLISNALKYTQPGGSVQVRSRLAASDVVFEVTDSGVGLSEDDCKRVFEKFYRVKKDREMASGTGLGLPLVKHIVEDIHNGRVEVESKLGEGSTFRLVLPSVGQLSA